MQKRFEALDAFRGLCAICVVLFHLRLMGSITEASFFRGSWIFVEFFFVLSGFVLAHGYFYKERPRFLKFFRSRFFRIYPLHVATLLLMLSLEGVKLLAHRDLGLDFIRPPFTQVNATSQILPNLLLLQSWIPFTENLSFNYPAWSISIEFYMYVVLFMTAAFFGRNKGIVWFFAAAISLYVLARYGNQPGYADFLAPLRGLSCFFSGAFTYAVYRKISELRINRYVGTAVEALLVASVVFVVSFDETSKRLLAILLFMATILVFSFESGYVSTLLKTRIPQATGRLSYSIYMTQAAILLCVTLLMTALEKFTDLVSSETFHGMPIWSLGGHYVSDAAAVFIACIVVLFSTVTYRHIEAPWLARGKNRRAAGQRSGAHGGAY